VFWAAALPEREDHETTRAALLGSAPAAEARHDEVTMDCFFEPRVRRLVAENLGVSLNDLTPDVSLRDDLAADSLDLVELALAIEEEFGLTVPEGTIAEVRTYRELVAGIVTLARSGAEARPAMEPVRVWVRVVAPAGVGGVLERAEWLTPYAAETIIEYTLRAGPGAQLEITVAEDGGDAGFRQVQQRFAWLGARGVAVDVHRDRRHKINHAA
jgi:acyl carrier protein